MSVKVTSPDEAVGFWVRRADYRLLARLLASGKAIVVKGSPQRVSKMKKRLTELVGEPVVSLLVEVDNEKVYIILRERDIIEAVESAEWQRATEGLLEEADEQVRTGA